MQKLTTTFFWTFLFLTSSFAQDGNKLQIFTPKELKKDFRILKECLEKSHAGLYTYTSKAELDQAFEQINLALEHPMTSIKFYRKITPLLKLIGNGHTNFYPPSEYRKAINSYLPRFPFALYQRADTIYILRNVSKDKSIVEGTILKSINGESAIEVFQELADNLTRDAENNSWPMAKVAGDFSGYYAFFKGTPKQFEIEILDKNGNLQERTIEGLTAAEIMKISNKKYPKENKKWKPFSFKIENEIGILDIKSFSLPTIKKHDLNYKKYFQKVFSELKTKQISTLIIDIRNNGGGYPEVVDNLLSYFLESDYVASVKSHTITKKLPHRKHYKYGFWENLEMRKDLKLKKQGNIYSVKGSNQNVILTPSPNAFKGELYVLINPFSFSGATDFLGMLKNIDRGIFIGETAGGSPHQVTARFMPTLILPNTKIKANIPLVHSKSKMKFEDNGKGVAPHFFIKNTIKEEMKNEDAVMNFTLKQIKK